MAIIQNYTVNDFKKALKKLLPPGLYWQTDDKDQAINLLLQALAQELKTTHDETELNVLKQVDKTLQGWKLTDYRAILTSNGKQGQVYDDPTNANVIYVDFEATNRYGDIMKYLESYRLPHTVFNWKANNNNQLSIATARKTIVINRVQATAI